MKCRAWQDTTRTSPEERGRDSHSGSWHGSGACSPSCCMQAEERLRRPPPSHHLAGVRRRDARYSSHRALPQIRIRGSPIRSRLRDTAVSGRASRVLPLRTSAWLACEVASTTTPTGWPRWKNGLGWSGWAVRGSASPRSPAGVDGMAGEGLAMAVVARSEAMRPPRRRSDVLLVRRCGQQRGCHEDPESTASWRCTRCN